MESESLGTIPILPPELEVLIFSFAIQDDLKRAGRFCFVAKRVHEWMLPRIYEIMVLDRPSNNIPHADISFKDLSRHGNHVRHLLLQNPPVNQDELGVYIGKCPNLISLALWLGPDPYHSTIVESLLRLRPKYLSLDISALIKSLEKQGHTSPIPFHSVTRIELIGLSEMDIRQVKDYFPALTHIAITALGSTQVSVLRNVVTLFGRQLKVIIWYRFLSREQDEPLVESDLNELGLDDPRLVELSYGRSFIGTWYQGAKGGLGIWRVAEEAVEARYRDKVG